MSAKASWSGNFQFGLISIPMKIYKLVGEAKRFKSRQLNAETNNPVGNKRYDKVTGDDVTSIAKGYELPDKSIVPVSQDEIDEMLPEKTKNMTLEAFVPRGSFSVDYLDTPYAVRTPPEFERAYSLVCRAMEERDIVAICRMVMSTQETLVVLMVREDGLYAYTLRWAEQLRDMAPTAPSEVSAEEMELALALADKNTDTDFDLSSLENEYNDRVEALILAKVNGEEIIAPEKPSKQSKEMDMVEVLQASLGD